MGKKNLLNTNTVNYLELIGNGKAYRVPPYQRDYSWEEEHTFKLSKIEYWFLDWYDGASKKLTGKSFELMEEIYNFFDECESTKSEYNKAMRR